MSNFRVKSMRWAYDKLAADGAGEGMDYMKEFSKAIVAEETAPQKESVNKVLSDMYNQIQEAIFACRLCSLPKLENHFEKLACDLQAVDVYVNKR